jgi:hypothetical protein
LSGTSIADAPGMNATSTTPPRWTDRQLFRRGKVELVKRDYGAAARCFEQAHGLARVADDRALIVRYWAEALSERAGERERAVALLTERHPNNGKQLAQLGYLLWRMKRPDGEPLLRRALGETTNAIELAQVQFALGQICNDLRESHDLLAAAVGTLGEELGGAHAFVAAVSVPLLFLGVKEVAPHFERHLRDRLKNDNSGQPDETWVADDDWARLEQRLLRELAQDFGPLVRAQVERRLGVVAFRNRRPRDAESFAIDALFHEAELLGDTPNFLQKETLELMAALSFSFGRFHQALSALQLAADPLKSMR